MRWIWLIAWTVAAVLGFSGGVRAAGPWGGTRGGGGSGGGGGGITNGAGSNVVMKSDGTNAVGSNISDDGSTVTVSGSGFDVPANSITDAEVSNTLTCSAASGNFTITGGSFSSGTQALNVTGAIPNSGGTSVQYGEKHVFGTTGSSSSADVPIGNWTEMQSGYTGSRDTMSIYAYSAVAGTGGASGTGMWCQTGNHGLRGSAQGTTTGANYAVSGYAAGGAYSIGASGVSPDDKASAVNIGVMGSGRNDGASGINVGVLALLMKTDPAPTIVDAALLVDNVDTTDPIAIFRDNGTAVLTIADNGTTTLAGDPASTATGDAMLRVVPSGSGANELLIFADGSTTDFTVDREGDVACGPLTVTGAITTFTGDPPGLSATDSVVRIVGSGGGGNDPLLTIDGTTADVVFDREGDATFNTTITLQSTIARTNSSNNGALHFDDAVRWGETTKTVASDGAGTAAAFTLTHNMTDTIWLVTCNDTDGCAATLDESDSSPSSMLSGVEIHIVNVSANNVTIADSAGVQETPGGNTITLAQWERTTALYVTDRWVVGQQ